MKARFIVLIDLSEYSKPLFRYAHRWARRANAELLVVHQTTDLLPGIGDAEVLSNMKQQSKKRALKQLSRFVIDTLGALEGVKLYVTAHTLEESFELLKRSKSYDVFFVGMKYKSLFEQLFTTSTTIKLANELEDLIIALPETQVSEDTDTLHIGLKHQYPLNEPAFNDLLQLSGDTVKKLHFFSVLKNNASRSEAEEYIKVVQAKYADRFAVTYDVYSADDTFREIKDYMGRNKGILVVQKGSRNIVDFFRKYFVNELVNYAQIPLIILPCKAADQ